MGNAHPNDLTWSLRKVKTFPDVNQDVAPLVQLHIEGQILLWGVGENGQFYQATYTLFKNGEFSFTDLEIASKGQRLQSSPIWIEATQTLAQSAWPNLPEIRLGEFRRLLDHRQIKG